MVPETPPTAEGELAQTPFAHLAVFALDRQMTGEMFICPEEGLCHVVRYERGTPTKIRVGDDFVRLGALLVEEGLVAEDVVESAVMTGGLLGDMLVLSGYVDSRALNAVLERQFRMRYARLFTLPPETTYSFFEGHNSLEEWGGEPSTIDPLELIWHGVRDHANASALFEPTLDLLGDTPLKLHPDAPVERFGFDDDCRTVIELMDIEPSPLSELLELEAPEPEVVRRLVYYLMIGRHLDSGKATKPVGVVRSLGGARNHGLAKLRLHSRAHRVGVALDAPGDGERSVRSISIRGRAVIPREEEASVPPPPVAPESSTDQDAVELADSDLLQSEPPPAAEAGSGIVDEPSGGEESSRRLIADAVRSLSHEALVKLALEKLEEKDPSTAAEICALGIRRLESEGKRTTPEAAEIVALHAWARSAEPSPDLKGLAIELDDLIRERDDHYLPRLVRGKIRKRLGNTPGALSDFRRVLEIDPSNADARAHIEGSDDSTASIRRGETGFLKRFFRR